jgi:hypothetical protein
MPSITMHKRFFSIDEISERFGLSLIDMGVLVAERQLRLSVPVVGLTVECGDIEEVDPGEHCRIPTGYRWLNGLVDLRPEDGWTVLRNGSAVVDELEAEPGRYIRISGANIDAAVLSVTREELGVRLSEWQRLESQASGADAPRVETLPRRRGVHATHDWDAFWIETCRTLYFDGIPQTQAALLRKMQDWFAGQGRKVPDESTLKRKLKPLWQTFASEAQRAAG